MEFSIDMRFFFTPLINTVLLLLTSPGRTISLLLACNQFDDQYPILKVASFLFAVMVLFLFLLTPIELHLNAHPKITMKIGYFSYPLTVSLLASILLPPPGFWVAHFFVLITFPYHGTMWYLQKCFFKWFLRTVRSIPTFEIGCTLTHQEDMTAEATPPASTSSPGFEVQSAVIEIEGNPT